EIMAVKYVLLMDDALDLPRRYKQSPLAREIAIEMAVDGPSYRTASKSLERIFGGQVISHEGIRQNLIKASDEVKVLLQRERENERPKESRSEEHTSELQSRENLVCRLLLEKKKILTY